MAEKRSARAHGEPRATENGPTGSVATPPAVLTHMGGPMQAAEQEPQAEESRKKAIDAAVSVEILLAQASLLISPTASKSEINVDVARGLVVQARRLAGELQDRLREMP